jgi:hypothetical protein
MVSDMVYYFRSIVKHSSMYVKDDGDSEESDDDESEEEN